MQISKIALLMALTAIGAIAAPHQGFEAALEQRGVDANKPVTTQLDARDVHDLNDENGRLTRRSRRPPRPAQIPETIPESKNEYLERQGGGRWVDTKPRPKPKPPERPTPGTKNEPTRAEKDKAAKKNKYGKNGRRSVGHN